MLLATLDSCIMQIIQKTVRRILTPRSKGVLRFKVRGFKVSNSPDLHVCGMCLESGAPIESMQIPCLMFMILKYCISITFKSQR